MKNKIVGLLLFSLIYIIAYTIGYFSTLNIENMILRCFVFDIVSTLVIWVVSLIFRNSSLYDAYWSLTPFIMLTYILFQYELLLYHYIFYLVFSLWSMRLTINWVITFENFSWEDWRYKMYRSNHPKLWPLINFFGIQMMPTLLVFAGFIPVILIFQSSINALSIVGIFFIFLGTILEFLADHEMHSFLKTKKDMSVCRNGLWKHSRHPNYLGEILIWFGCYISLVLTNSNYWYMFFGFLLMICLFEFISIPMMEKRQIERRPDYLEYRKETTRILILPNKKRG